MKEKRKIKEEKAGGVTRPRKDRHRMEIKGGRRPSSVSDNL